MSKLQYWYDHSYQNYEYLLLIEVPVLLALGLLTEILEVVIAVHIVSVVAVVAVVFVVALFPRYFEHFVRLCLGGG